MNSASSMSGIPPVVNVPCTQCFYTNNRSITDIKKQVQTIVAPLLCPQGGCILQSERLPCKTCKELMADRCPALLSFFPAKNGYLVAQIDEIITACKYVLSENERIVILIYNAQQLSFAAVNRLLHIVEEPPAGYYFIFLASHEGSMIQTLTSRCVVNVLPDEQDKTGSLSEMPVWVAALLPGGTLQGMLQYDRYAEQTINQKVVFDKVLVAWQGQLVASIYPSMTVQHILKELVDGIDRLPHHAGWHSFWYDLALRIEDIKEHGART